MRILFVDTAHPVLINSLRKNGYECISGYELSYDEILQSIGDYHGIVIRSRIRLDRKLLEKAEKLKFIARAGAGMESIDVDFARSKNIECINSPEGNRDAVGEHAIGMLLSLMNNLNRADRQIRSGEWKRESNRGHELSGKTVGIIGFGNMGSAFASKLRGFDCEIMAFDKYKNGFGNSFVKEALLEDLFEHADVLSIHVPLTDETKYFINVKFIDEFKKNIYFVNTSRGKCVRTSDLVNNIESGKILGACLDVIEFEETSFEELSIKGNFSKFPEWNYLINSDKVILSPHIAGWTYESLEKIAAVLFQKIINCINKK